MSPPSATTTTPPAIAPSVTSETSAPPGSGSDNPPQATETTVDTGQAAVGSTPDSTNAAAADSQAPREPDPLLAVLPGNELTSIREGIGLVKGIAKDGWVKVERQGGTSVVLTTSDGLRIEIAARNSAKNPVNLNSRGMVIVEHDDEVTVAGAGLKPNSEASTWLFSTPRQLGVVNVDSEGSFSEVYKIGPDVAVGDHTAQINGLAPNGTLRSVDVAVEVVARRASVPYTPTQEPERNTEVIVSALVMLGALAATRRRDDRGSADIAEIAVKFNTANHDAKADRYVPPAISRVDEMSRRWPTRMTRVSPMLSRVIDDGVYLRAMTGSFWMLLPPIGVVLGLLAAVETGFEVLVPPLLVVLLLLALGCLDAFSGFLAAATFGIACLVGGGITTGDDVRGLLGLWVLAFAAPLASSAARPFRRRKTGHLDRWNRLVDFAQVTLFGAWAAGTVFGALPALVGVKPEFADRVGAVQLTALVVLAARFGLESLSTRVTPRRLAEIERDGAVAASDAQQLASAVVRAAVFAFVASVFVGNGWVLWVGTAIYLAPKLVSAVNEKLPNIVTIHRWLPRNVLKVVVMLFVARWWTTIITSPSMEPLTVIERGFVFAGVPGLILTALGWFGRSGATWRSTPVSRIGGTVLLVFGVLVVLGIVF